jgi:SET domain-containing protein
MIGTRYRGRNVEVRASEIGGRGVFATRGFEAGERILRRDDSRLVTEAHPLSDGEDEEHCDWIADGRVVYVQEPERYTNHSCDPNAYKEVDAEGVRYCTARRGIAAGEEITTDYRIDNSGDGTFECHCGSDRCEGTVRASFFRLTREMQLEYLPYLSPWFKKRFPKEIEALAEAAQA